MIVGYSIGIGGLDINGSVYLNAVVRIIRSLLDIGRVRAVRVLRRFLPAREKAKLARMGSGIDVGHVRERGNFDTVGSTFSVGGSPECREREGAYKENLTEGVEV
jgi:hypothetical protein